jgi:uncharacterized protein YggE
MNKINMKCVTCLKDGNLVDPYSRLAYCTEKCWFNSPHPLHFSNNGSMITEETVTVKKQLDKENNKGRLEVKGYGKVAVMPDLMKITMANVYQSDTPEKVNSYLNDKISQAILIAKEHEGIEDISTIRLDITTIYETEEEEIINKNDEQSYNENVTITKKKRKSEPKIVGYAGNYAISFIGKIKASGEVMDMIMKNKLMTDVDKVNFIVSEALVQPAISLALKKATTNAMTKASVVLDTLNKTISGIPQINIYEQNRDYNVEEEETSSRESYSKKKSMFRSSIKLKESANIVSGGKQYIDVNVSMIVQYK